MKKEFIELIVTIGIALLEYFLLEKSIGLRSKLKKITKNFFIYFFVVIGITVVLYYVLDLFFINNKYYYLISKISMGTMIFLLLSDFSKITKKQ